MSIFNPRVQALRAEGAPITKSELTESLDGFENNPIVAKLCGLVGKRVGASTLVIRLDPGKSNLNDIENGVIPSNISPDTTSQIIDRNDFAFNFIGCTSCGISETCPNCLLNHLGIDAVQEGRLDILGINAQFPPQAEV